jgi:pilus assembly protein Flp/PilA
MLRRFIRGEEGAALVEYGLLVALIAVVCIAILTLLGGELAEMFGFVEAEIDTVENGAGTVPAAD